MFAQFVTEPEQEADTSSVSALSIQTLQAALAAALHFEDFLHASALAAEIARICEAECALRDSVYGQQAGLWRVH